MALRVPFVPDPERTPPPEPSDPGPTSSGPSAASTPLYWRLLILAAIVAATALTYVLRDPLREAVGLRGQAFVGVFCFFGLVAAFSANLRIVNWRTIAWGIALQLALAVLVLRVTFIYHGFEAVGRVVKSFINFSNEGAAFVFGDLVGPTASFKFAFVALPPILFVSAFFTMLYHFGILQKIVQYFAQSMVHLMGTSGAETLSVAANVFMGQTEAPLIVKPYVPRMTNSELFTLMASGMAHISGGLMVVYITYGADPVAVMTTCVMACPCALYLSKLFLPETSVPETAGTVHKHKEPSPYVNAIDAIAAGTTDGLQLALNVAAMLIVFIAFVAMINGILGEIKPLLLYLHVPASALADWPDKLSLQMIFGWMFSPVAFLMGVAKEDAAKVGSLLGSKLAVNEHYAYLQMKAMKEIPNAMSVRSYQLTAFALTGFANFASIGIQLGGIGAIAPNRRHDLARLGGKALFVGFTATLLNAAIAGLVMR